MSEILMAAMNYAKQGIKVVAMHGIVNGRCTCGNDNCHSPGKHPATPNGSNDATDNLGIIESWFTGHERNIAIMPAMSGMVAVDIDPRNGGRVGHLPKAFRKTPHEITNGDGYHFYFRADERYRYKHIISKGIEVKYNSLINCAPSMHSSGARYRWIKSILDYDLLDAPEMLIDGEIDGTFEAEECQSIEVLLDVERDEIRQLLDRHIDAADDYQLWIEVGMCLRGVDGGYDLWHDWSAKNHKYRGEDECLRKWRSFKPWRSDRRPLRWTSLWHKLGERTDRVSDEVEDDDVEKIAMNAHAEVQENHPKPEKTSRLKEIKNPGPFPVACLEEMMEYIGVEDDKAKRAIILSILSIAAGRNFTIDGKQLMLFHIIIVDDCFIFFEIANCIRDILCQIGDGTYNYARHFRDARIGSSAELEKILADRQKIIYAPSDVMQSFNLFGKQPSGNMSSALRLISSIHSSPGGTMFVSAPKKKAGKAVIDDDGQDAIECTADDSIHNPFVSMIGGVWKNEINESFKKMYIPKQSIISTIDGNIHIRKTTDIPQAFIDLFVKVFNAMRPRSDAPSKVMRQIEVVFPDDIPRPSFGPLSNAMASPYAMDANHKAICAILAIAANPDNPVVSFEMSRWSEDYITAGAYEAYNLFLTVEEMCEQSVYDSVLAYVTKAGKSGIEWRDLISKCKKLRCNLDKAKREELISRMVDDCVIYIERGPKGGMTIFEGREKK